MAFYNESSDDPDQQDPNAQTPGAQTQSGSSVITGLGAGGGSPQQKTNAPDRPGNFVNLQDYLNANKTQAGKLGDQASGVINQSADAARQGVSAFNQEAADKIKPVNSLAPDVSDKIKNSAEQLSPEERAQVKNTQTAKYQGPAAYTDLNTYQSAADTTQKATQNIDNSGTEQGRMNLVSQINSKPRTQGMNVFDNALLQSGGGREKLAQASNANQDVKGGLDTATQAAQSQIGRADDPSTPNVDESAGAIGQTNKAQADAYKQVQDALGAWTSGFQPKVSQAQDNLVGLQNRVTGDISDNPFKLNDETMNLLGLNRGQRLFNTDLSSYLKQASPTDINAANVASPEDYARYGALADLAGEQNPLLDSKNISQAGKVPRMTADSTKLQADIGQAQQNYDNAYKTAVGAVSQFADLPAEYAGYTPIKLETEILPRLQSEGYGGAPILKNAIEKWRASQGFNNIVNGYGQNNDVTPPTFAGSGPNYKI